MAANSKNKLDVLIWLEKIVDSCTTKEQVDNARKLFLLYENKYNPTGETKYLFDRICDLYIMAVIKRSEIVMNDLENKLKTK